MKLTKFEVIKIMNSEKMSASHWESLNQSSISHHRLQETVKSKNVFVSTAINNV